MPPDAQVLDAVLDRLLPLAQKDGGARLHAPDWNTLVQALGTLCTQLGGREVDWSAPVASPAPVDATGAPLSDGLVSAWLSDLEGRVRTVEAREAPPAPDLAAIAALDLRLATVTAELRARVAAAEAAAAAPGLAATALLSRVEATEQAQAHLVVRSAAADAALAALEAGAEARLGALEGAVADLRGTVDRLVDHAKGADARLDELEHPLTPLRRRSRMSRCGRQRSPHQSRRPPACAARTGVTPPTADKVLSA
jgi:hypothetical protein